MPTALIEAAGGRNIMDDLETSWGYVSWEAVAERDPDFLILLDYPNDGGAEKLFRQLQAHPLDEAQRCREKSALHRPALRG